jgi:hypothetical protein
MFFNKYDLITVFICFLNVYLSVRECVCLCCFVIDTLYSIIRFRNAAWSSCYGLIWREFIINENFYRTIIQKNMRIHLRCFLYKRKNKFFMEDSCSSSHSWPSGLHWFIDSLIHWFIHSYTFFLSSFIRLHSYHHFSFYSYYDKLQKIERSHRIAWNRHQFCNL